MKARTRDRSSATSGAGAKELTPVCSHTVRLGLQLTYDDPVAGVALAQEADRLGFHSVWTSEAYGTDAVTPMAWIAATTSQIQVGSAIMQMTAPPPPPAAATGAALPYATPSAGADATGLGKPLKIIIHPLRSEVPIYLAAIGPKNVALAAEIADGWLPIFFSPERAREVHGPALEEGFAPRGGRPGGWDLAPLVPVVVDDDVQACRDLLKPMLALYIGGMGARRENFFNRLPPRGRGKPAPGSPPRGPERRRRRGRAGRPRRRDRAPRRPPPHRRAARRLAGVRHDDADPAGAPTRGA